MTRLHTQISFLSLFLLLLLVSPSGVFADDAATQFGLRPATADDAAQSQGNIVRVKEADTRPQQVEKLSRPEIIVRDNAGNTSVLPPVSSTTANNLGGNPTGIGAPPAASDGPVTYPGAPTGLANPNTRTEGIGAAGNSPLHKEQAGANDEALGLFFGPLFSEEFAKDLEAEEEAFWDYMSGSGGAFGDCVGADCIPSFGYPGRPYGGLPIGSWVHHDLLQVNRRFATDSVALNAVNQGNFQQAESLISAALGQEVRRDPRGRAF